MVDILTITIIVLIVSVGVVAALFFAARKSKVDTSQSEAIRDLERRLTDLMTVQLKEIRDSQLGTSQEMNKHIFAFAKEATHIREELKQVEGLMKDVSSFQDLFRAPKLRGQWGEASLEHVLSQHFPQELYEIQHLFSSGEQVDAVLKLPNGRILPIDSKFPSENFVRMAEVRGEERDLFQKSILLLSRLSRVSWS